MKTERENLSRLAVKFEREAIQYPAGSFPALWYTDQSMRARNAAVDSDLHLCHTPECPNLAAGDEYCARCREETDRIDYPLADVLSAPVVRLGLGLIAAMLGVSTVLAYLIFR